MKLSKGGIAFIGKWEGRENKVYEDVAGYPTIGIGHLLTHEELQSGKILIRDQPFRYASGLQDEQIDALFLQDSATAQQAINDSVHVDIEQYQFDMLVSLAFNIGVGAFKRSTLLKLLNRGQIDAVPNQLIRWVYSGGKKIQGLINRRSEAAEIWKKNSNVYFKYYNDNCDKLKTWQLDAQSGTKIVIKPGLVVNVHEKPDGHTEILITNGEK